MALFRYNLVDPRGYFVDYIFYADSVEAAQEHIARIRKTGKEEKEELILDIQAKNE